MKFFKLGTNYWFKNIGYISLLWVIPAVFAGLLCGPYQIIQFINYYPKTQISSFGDIFNILMPIGWLRLLVVIGAIALVSIFLSMTIGEMERHMRSGKFSFKNIFAFINNEILVVFVNIVLLVIIYFILTFILGSILFLFHLIFSGLTNIPTLLNSIVAIVLCCVIIVLYTLAVALFLINIPNMITNGYSLKEGISSTCQLISKKTFKILLAYVLPYVIIIPFVCGLANTSIIWIPNIICTFLQWSYYSSLTMTSFFELSNLPRYDNRKYYNYNK